MQRILPHKMSMFPHSGSEVPSKQEQSLTKHSRTTHLPKLCIHESNVVSQKKKMCEKQKNQESLIKLLKKCLFIYFFLKEHTYIYIVISYYSNTNTNQRKKPPNLLLI